MIQEWSKRSLPLAAQNAGLNLPKASISTIGPPPVKYSAWLVAMLLTGNSFLHLQTKMFTMDAEIHMQINFIRCAGGQIILRTAVFFCFSKSPLDKPWLLFFLLKGINKLQCNPYYPAIFVIRLFFNRLVTTFGLILAMPKLICSLQTWAAFTIIFYSEQLIHRVTLDWSLNLTLSQMQINPLSMIF